MGKSGMRRMGTVSATLAMALALSTGTAALATPGGAQRPTVDDAQKVIKCLVIDGQKFCTELGFLGENASPGSWKEWLEASLVPAAEESGDAGLADIVAYLEGLSAKELAARQNEQIAQARQAVGKVRLVELPSSGTEIPPGFYSKYPELQVAEGSTEAAELRSVAGVASAGQTVRVASVSPYPSYRYILSGWALDDQDTYYWCGPATMQFIEWTNDNTKESQSHWADTLDTNDLGGITSIDSIVAHINSDTTWDNAAGPYSFVNIDGQGPQYIQWVMQYNVGLQGAPVVLHPTLRTQFFPGIINYDHGGHFQTGRGYDATKVYYVEPHDERDFNTAQKPNGAASGGYRSVTFSNMYSAIIYSATPALRTLGY